MDPDQLASQKPADPDLHCFPKRIYPGFGRTRVNIRFKYKKMRSGL